MRALLAGLAAIASIAGTAHAAPPPVAVEFVDASRPTRCAEEDNVHVRVLGDAIGAFRISAVHPPYIASVREDSTAPDFTDCDMSSDPVHRFEPLRVVLHEDPTLRVVGHRFETFWRPGGVAFAIAGGPVVDDLHLVQLIRRGPERDVEMLVVYPLDGYWRAKPLPPAHLPDTAYGSSFLVGPVEEAGRPVVAMRRIELDPATLGFRLSFADGTGGTLRIERAASDAIDLAVTLSPPTARRVPFAALRSMYVRRTQADVSVVQTTLRGVTGAARPVMGFGRVRAERARFGRDLPSVHNLSAPDMRFDGFVRGPASR